MQSFALSSFARWPSAESSTKVMMMSKTGQRNLRRLQTRRPQVHVQHTCPVLPVLSHVGTEVVTDGAGIRCSECPGRGHGGRLSQMKQIERIQMERSKRPSKIDIAMQGENVNPMAPSSQAIGERGRTKRDSSDEVAISRTPAQSSLQPQFLQATPGQQFGFRVPDATSWAESDTRAPPRARFCGVSSQPSSRGSGPPLSQSTSLFSGGSLGTNSTAATSRAPSICSSTGERGLAKQRDPSSQHARSPTPSTSRISDMDDLPRSSQFEHPQPDAASLPNPTRLQQTASFYG